ncbi:MAG: hypothetical protein ACRCSN_03550 [Dermatophilaceae bacterium]
MTRHLRPPALAQPRDEHQRAHPQADVLGYTYRWVRPLDDVVADQGSEWFAGLSPLHQQLLGYGPDHASFWGITQSGWIDDDIPLRAELKKRGLLDPTIPYLR